jgi:hypothetical protein
MHFQDACEECSIGAALNVKFILAARFRAIGAFASGRIGSHERAINHNVARFTQKKL